jgi:DNA-binding beta-propeller fold protein YncE
VAKRSDWFNAIKVLPALLIALTLLAAACHPSSAFSPDESGGGGSATTTPTPIPGTGSFAYSTNFLDGTVSEFSRNTTTGVLTSLGSIGAGAKSGPKGLEITPANTFLYVANFGDGKIYEYSINGSTGKLSAVGSINNGTGSGPQYIAIDPSGLVLWVTGAGSQSVNAYAIASNGKLSSIGSPFTPGFSDPLGIVEDPSGEFLFVSDSGNGFIYPLTINSNGTLTQTFPPVQSAQAGAVTPGLLVDDSTNPIPTLWVTDQDAGIVSPFEIETGGELIPGTPTTDPSGPNVKPFGIGIATLSTEYLFTADQASGGAQAYSISGQALTPTALVTGLSAPTGLTVDPQNTFVYVADQGDAEITELQINGTCNPTPSLCPVGTADAGNGPFAIVLTH